MCSSSGSPPYPRPPFGHLIPRCRSGPGEDTRGRWPQGSAVCYLLFKGMGSHRRATPTIGFHGPHAQLRWGADRRKEASPQPLLAEHLGKDHRCVYRWLPCPCCEKTRLNPTAGSGLVSSGERENEQEVGERVRVLRGRGGGRPGEGRSRAAHRLPWQMRGVKAVGHPALTGLQFGWEPGQSRALTCRCGPGPGEVEAPLRARGLSLHARSHAVVQSAGWC